MRSSEQVLPPEALLVQLEIPEHDSSKASVLGFEVYLRAGSVKRPHAALLLGPALDGLLQLP